MNGAAIAAKRRLRSWAVAASAAWLVGDGKVQKIKIRPKGGESFPDHAALAVACQLTAPTGQEVLGGNLRWANETTNPR
jgi:hypothetical protein